MNSYAQLKHALFGFVIIAILAGVMFFTSDSKAARIHQTDEALTARQSFNIDKIDAAVQSALAANTSVTVLILGQSQLLQTPNGYAKYIKENEHRLRSELRAENIATLKEIAASEQEVILEKLGDPQNTQPAWLVNAIIATLSQEQIHAASLIDEVKYIYPGEFHTPSRNNPGTIQSVLSPPESILFTTSGKRIPWNLERIGASRVWNELGFTGESSVIAAIDTGINYLHSDLTNNIWINENEIANNGLDDDSNGFIDDYYGYDFGLMRSEIGVFGDSGDHGTWVSGILAGDGTGGIVTGVAPRAKVMLLKINSIYTAILAHQYALEMGADVVNMSFSIPNLGNSRGVWRLLAEHADISGLVLVSGAGNFQQSAQIPVQLRIPEGIPSVIAAGGVDQNLAVTTFSSSGPVEWESVKFYEDFAELTKPDVAAFPGAGYPVLNTAGNGYVDPNNSIRGNSFSGPHVSGTAALMLSANPELPAWRVKEILEDTAQDIAPAGKDNLTGAGLIDAFQAVLAASLN
jgi:subtilisin family serine protease